MSARYSTVPTISTPGSSMRAPRAAIATPIAAATGSHESACAAAKVSVSASDSGGSYRRIGVTRPNSATPVAV